MSSCHGMYSTLYFEKMARPPISQSIAKDQERCPGQIERGWRGGLQVLAHGWIASPAYVNQLMHKSPQQEFEVDLPIEKLRPQYFAVGSVIQLEWMCFVLVGNLGCE